MLEKQLAEFHASRSWRVTAPLRWFSVKVNKRGAPPSVPLIQRTEGAATAVSEHTLDTPAGVAIDKRLVALDQLGARIRRMRK